MTLKERIDYWKKHDCRCKKCFAEIFWGSGIEEALEEAVPFMLDASFQSVFGEANTWVEKYGYEVEEESTLVPEAKEYCEQIGEESGKKSAEFFDEVFGTSRTPWADALDRVDKGAISGRRPKE